MLQAAIGLLLDAAKLQAIDVDDALGLLDAQLHEIDKRGPARKKAHAGPLLGRGGGRCRRNGRRAIRCALQREGLHGLPPARWLRRTCWMAATMLGYAPHRQMLPLMNSRTSSSDGPHGSLRSATADMIWPDVQ